MSGLRRPVVAVLFAFAASVLMSGTASAAAGMTVDDLRVDYQTNPLGIDDPHPTLSWRLKSTVRGDRQTAYQILVASNVDLRPDIWDSGKVVSGNSVGVPYSGPDLRSRHRYYWTVRTWDAAGKPSTLASAAWWETGLLGSADWVDAQWITPDTGVFRWQDVTGNQLDQGSPMLRHAFALDKPVASARAYVYGLGFYELRLNGSKVGDHVLTPAATPFDQRNLYDTYDVTGQVRQGSNAVGIWLGSGYGPHFSQYGYRWSGPNQAIMLLAVTFADGTQRTVTTDDTWRWSASPITANDIYDGETYDARLQQDGWDKPDFDDSAWKAVRLATAPSQVLASNDMPPIRVVQTLRAVQVTQPKPGAYIYDFGQDIAGWERLSVTGPAGTTVRMRTAEELNADGTLDTATNRNAASTDTYVLSAGTQTYEPRFTYHGFRYLEVTGYPGTPTLDSVVAQVVHADVASTGTLETSDPLVNRIWQNNRWAMLNNSMSLPTDTPVRDERTSPGMDVQAYRDAAVLEFGMDRFYGQYLLDNPASLPSYAEDSPQPDMGGGAVTLAWTLYEQYGDLPVLARSYPGMKDYVNTAAKVNPGLVWPDRGFGDWCPPDRGPNVNGGQGRPDIGNCFSEQAVVNTALFYLQVVDTAKAAAALDHQDDATHFNQLAAGVAKAFNTRFLDAGGTTYGDGRQVTSVLPLAFGMVPADKVAGVGAHLVDTILHKDGGHLDTGIFGTRYLVDALARIGRMDVVKTVLDQTTYPGFGYEIGRGATTPWEEWTYQSNMETHDHAMFAGVNASFYTQLAGITPVSPGYASINVAPQVGLDHVSASIDTVRGMVTSAWTGKSCTLDVSIPVNAVATVSVPVRPDSKVTAPPGAEPLGGGRYSVGSGTWTFSVDRC